MRYMKSIPSIFAFKNSNIVPNKIIVSEDYAVLYDGMPLSLDKNMYVNINNEIKIPFANLFTLAYFSDLLTVTCEDIKESINKIIIDPVTDLVVQIKDNKKFLDYNNLIISSMRYSLELK